MTDQRHTHCLHPAKAGTHQKRRGQRHGRAKTRRALDEKHEEPGDQQGDDSRIIG